ncbi:MAG: VCBS repeat-containing protein [Candidatus Kapabacteria bacterium]|nr:VCBS repeat-containing protein [Candidatus Kapabacteria bacterium]
MILIVIIALCATIQLSAQESQLRRGERLAASVCGTCHAVPAPDVLDKASWKNVVLPRMGTFLGIYPKGTSRKSLIEEGAAFEYILSHNIYPEQPTISTKDWKLIRDYYVANAPKRLPPNKSLPTSLTRTFKAVRPAFALRPPTTTYVDIDDESGTVVLGDAVSGSVYTLSPMLELRRRDSTGESPAWVTKQNGSQYATIMGSFSPTDAPTGRVVQILSDTSAEVTEIIAGLQRPVHHAVADLDADGDEDIVVCEFGKWTGGLSWWRRSMTGTYERMVLRDGPGATRAVIRDWNMDGLPDIIALFAQGNESISVFLNAGNGSFEEQQIMQFPPSWGTSYFSIGDVDADGDVDIVHCAGDNADFGPVLRPYHGIRLFLNNGKNSFPDTIFVPLHGAYNAIPADFDLDGDIDIAAISFFPDYAETPARGFVFFENQGDWKFTASTFPEVGSGRWIVMDAGDIDRDGDQDLALGSLAFEVPGKNELVDGWVKDAIPFIILENLTR